MCAICSTGSNTVYLFFFFFWIKGPLHPLYLLHSTSSHYKVLFRWVFPLVKDLLERRSDFFSWWSKHPFFLFRGVLWWHYSAFFSSEAYCFRGSSSISFCSLLKINLKVGDSLAVSVPFSNGVKEVATSTYMAIVPKGFACIWTSTIFIKFFVFWIHINVVSVKGKDSRS